jgi:phosphoribosylformimino-5-aminoimidazole carboxamide ribotide isomerase
MIEIIPAIDLVDGRCVRLSQGDFDRVTVYSDDPLEMAKRFERLGLRRVHMVDLDGARRGKPANLNVLARVAARTNLIIDFGGGITSGLDLEDVFTAGASIANIGSLAFRQPETFLGWQETYGNDRILLGADCRNEMIAINGWQTETDVSVIEFLKEKCKSDLRRAFVTDIARDGAMSGPSIELYRRILDAIPDLELMASGGVRTIQDIQQLEDIGCSGVIVGKAIYEGRISEEELSRYAR